MVLSFILQFSIAWVYGLFFEYAIHRWVLHKYGKKRSSIVSFHFHEHHAIVRRRNMYDESYITKSWEPNSRTKELASLFLAAILHIPIAIIFPWAGLAILLSIVSYYFQHAKSHKNVEWARVVLPWHYDHHMGPNQDMNFGVRSDIFDKIFRTRLKYYGTRGERIDYHRRIGKYARHILRKNKNVQR